MADDPLADWSGPRYATVDIGGGYETNPFVNAANYAAGAQGTVDRQITYFKESILGKGDFNAFQEFTDAMDELEKFKVDIDWSLATERPDLDQSVELIMDVGEIDTTQFGKVTSYTPGPAPSADTLPTISPINIPAFTSTVTIDVPKAPGPGNITPPGDAPPDPGFEYPDAPPISLPSEPDLLAINMPGAPTVDLPTLSLENFPVLQELNIDTLINWTEPTYTPEIWTDVETQIQTFLAGGTGIRPDVEEAIVNRGRDREDRIIRQQVQQATEEWANRGYTAPPGMLAKRIDNIREEGDLKKLGLQREVVIKSMEEEIANLRFAVQQGIAAEQLFIQIHLAAAERAFEVQKLAIQWQIELYNLAIEIYKARLQENVIRAQVYEVQVRAALAEIEVFKALVDAERAKAEVNKAIVEAYTAEIQARETIVNIYKAQVEAVGIQAEVFATRVRAYGEEVNAYAAKVGADKLRFDAYESRVRGEIAKANVFESEARAYQAEVQGIEVGVRAEVGALEGAVSAFRAEVESYEAELRSWAVKNQNELAQIQANVEGHRIDIQRFVAGAGIEVEAARTEGIMWEAENRLELEAFRTRMEQLRILMEKTIQESGLLLEATKTSGQLASTISAGALAAMHVGATTSGQGSVSATGNDGVSFAWRDSETKQCTTSKQVQVQFEAATEPELDCII